MSAAEVISGLAVIALVVGGLAVYIWTRRRTQPLKPASPTVSDFWWPSGDEQLLKLKVGDVVSQLGTRYKLVGSITFDQGDNHWAMHKLTRSTEHAWLLVETGEDGEPIVTWTSADFNPTWLAVGAEKLDYNGEHTLQSTDKYSYTSNGDTDQAPTGTCTVHRYTKTPLVSGHQNYLIIIKFDKGNAVAYVDNSVVLPEHLQVYPA